MLRTAPLSRKSSSPMSRCLWISRITSYNVCYTKLLRKKWVRFEVSGKDGKVATLEREVVRKVKIKRKIGLFCNVDFSYNFV